MTSRIQLGGMAVDVAFKDIKNVHLSVYPPVGKVRISAPKRMKLDLIRVYAISKLSWIKQQQRKLRQQLRETPREYLDRESHYLWGKRYLLKIIEGDKAPKVVLKHSKMMLVVRHGSSERKRQEVLDEWYRMQIKKATLPLLEKWEQILGVASTKFYVQHMKTMWGSCNPFRKTIRLNTELAKKPLECLEYIIVHELIHFLEPTHNKRFVALLDQFMPNWRHHREALNRLPIRHESWTY